jgi:hypothetical protein
MILQITSRVSLVSILSHPEGWERHIEVLTNAPLLLHYAFSYPLVVFVRYPRQSKA